MTSPFRNLSRANLVNLASALEAGRFPVPFRKQSFANYVPSSLLKAVAQAGYEMTPKFRTGN